MCEDIVYMYTLSHSLCGLFLPLYCVQYALYSAHRRCTQTCSCWLVNLSLVDGGVHQGVAVIDTGACNKTSKKFGV